MDNKTKEILENIQSHSRIKEIITITCYILIAGGVLTYIVSAFHTSKTIKLVNDVKENKRKYKSEKVMVNPRIKFQYNDNQIYNVRAKKAFHKDESEVILYDVFADGDIGTITSGQLKIDESGNHLIFSKNPVLTLNEK